MAARAAQDLDIRAVAVATRRRIARYIVETPLARSAALSEATGAGVFFKSENLQVTGSFKARGAFASLLALGRRSRAKGIVTASTGNHGAAIAHAAATLGTTAIVFVPENASDAKLANIRRSGGDIRVFGAEGGATEAHARAFADARRLKYVSPYNDAAVIAGQSTIGLEIARQGPQVEVVVAPLGGGGLIGGIASYLKAVRPDVTVIGVSPRNSKSMIESVRAGRIVETPHLPTLSDGTAGGVEPGSITFDLCRRFVDDFIDVDEESIRAAMRLFVETQHQLLEGSAALGIAGLLASGRRFAGRTVAVVISGANIDAARLKDAL